MGQQYRRGDCVRPLRFYKWMISVLDIFHLAYTENLFLFVYGPYIYCIMQAYGVRY